MFAPQRNNRPLADEVLQLSADCLSTDCTEQDVQRLETLLRDNRDARRLYVQYAQEAAALRTWAAGRSLSIQWAAPATAADVEADGEAAPSENAAPEFTDSSVEEQAAAGRRAFAVLLGQTLPRAIDFRTHPARFAASVVMLTSAVWLVLFTALWLQRGSDPAQVEVAAPAIETPRFVVARVSGLHEVQWADTARPKQVGNPVAAGETLQLASGLLAIEFNDGAHVILEGPAEFRPDRSGSGRLSQGKLVAQVPKEATGFVVETEAATITDLGTEFGVNVAQLGEAEILVFDGMVEVQADDRRQILQRGEAVVIQRPAPQQPPVIVSRPVPRDQFVRELPVSVELQGSVAELRRLVTAHPRLLHHYPFEGATPEEKRRDRKGELHLVEVAIGGEIDACPLDYRCEGCDSSTSAVRISRIESPREQSTAMQTTTAFQPPKALTVELLLRCDSRDTDPGPGPVHAAVATRSNDNDCGYFVTTDGQGQLRFIFEKMADYTNTGVRLARGHWHYLAASFDVQDDTTVVNAYLADLSRGQVKLRQIAKNKAVRGIPATSVLGIGKVFDGGGRDAYAWDGALDEIALYDVILEPNVLQNHLNAIVRPPETNGGTKEQKK